MSKDINVESWWDGVEVDISGPLEGLRELVEAFEETLGAGENASFPEGRQVPDTARNKDNGGPSDG
jgi:hypothetical protein